MKFLLCNNFVRGGSGIDEVVRQEVAVLQGAGHEVVLMDRSNWIWDEAGWLGKIRLAWATLYSNGARRQVRELLKNHQFDVIHVHNTVPFMTDSIYDAMNTFNGIVVQHLHNYRFVCPSSYAFRSGRPCLSCRWCGDLSCVWFRCYRKSYLASLGLVASRWISAGRRVLGRREPDIYLAVSEAIKEAYIREGRPACKVMVIPNPVRDLSGVENRGAGRKRKLVFVGAVLEAKGVLFLPALAKLLPGYQIHIVGAGEDENRLREEVRLAGVGNIHIHGVA
jgi:glycosyltransferase involved in cell wall biosynthesis